MLKWAIIFAVIALVAGVFGFTGVAAGAAGIAKILFVLFLVVAAVMLVMALIGGNQPCSIPEPSLLGRVSREFWRLPSTRIIV